MSTCNNRLRSNLRRKHLTAS
uniref:Uncharacterized protein n=1 Tax=Rhizophora mucronata TaxID=61149 RepID=A0A2P2IX56_RHIMU